MIEGELGFFRGNRPFGTGRTEDPNFFQFFSPDAYAVGINILVWMMTH
jgi:hypothetical protein